MRPHVLLSAAMSLDGRLDDASPSRLVLSDAADLALRAARSSLAGSPLATSRHATASFRQIPSIVRKCCSASVSVGAISTP